jgi:hypothetical protein
MGPHMAGGGRARLLLLVCAALSAVLGAQAQLVIRRNSQDCVFPAVAADAFKLWPTRAYLPSAATVRAVPGGFLVRVRGCSPGFAHNSPARGPGLQMRWADRRGCASSLPQVESSAGFSIEYRGTYKVIEGPAGRLASARSHPRLQQQQQ